MLKNQKKLDVIKLPRYASVNGSPPSVAELFYSAHTHTHKHTNTQTHTNKHTHTHTNTHTNTHTYRKDSMSLRIL